MKNALKILLYAILLRIFTMNVCVGQCQNLKVGIPEGKTSFLALIRYFEMNSGARFYFDPDSIPDITINIEKDSVKVFEILQEHFNRYGIRVSCDSQGNFFITRGAAINTGFQATVYERLYTFDEEIVYGQETDDFIVTHDEYISDTIIIGNAQKGFQRQRVLFTGFVKDSKTEEPVIGATIYVKELETGTATGIMGNFELLIPRGEYTLVVSSAEKETHKYNLYLNDDGSAVLYLETKLIELDEVIVTADKYDKIKSTHMGIERLTAKEIKEIPTVLGERDVLKVAQMLPGIQKSGEGVSGFNVRGSPADQNIFYLNGIPIYNVSHLVGFFSAFQSEAISEFSIYKSNIPVQYGGRLSSIFDIEVKNGNREKTDISGGISPVSANIFLNQPLNKKGSIMAGGRSTYSNWLLRQVKNPEVRNSNVYFGDVMGSVEYDIGKTGNLEVFGYYSKDELNYNHTIEHTYDNLGLSASWNTRLREKHLFKSSFVYSRYTFDETNREIAFDLYRHRYYIKQYDFRNILVLHPHARHSVIAGIDNSLYNQSRGYHFILSDEQVLESTDLGAEQGLETGLFISDDWNISPKLSMYGGVRYTLYSYLGPQKIYQYNSEGFHPENIIDTVTYGKGDIIKTYRKPDVRLAFKYLVHPLVAVKISYNQLQQNIFMLSNTLSMSPVDKWKLADYHIKPLSGEQYSFGVYFKSPKRKWDFAAEGYYKTVAGLVEYKDGANLLITRLPETELIQGDLAVYGIEFMLERIYGKLTGWVNYAYTHTEVKVSSTDPLRQVNSGLPFPAGYDKPHAFNMVCNYRFKKRISMSWNIVYSTGRPYTGPVSVYYLYGNPVINYTRRNEVRIPDYFRMDFSMNVEGNLKAKKYLHGSWMFSVYNLTGRNNAYSVFFVAEGKRIRGYKLSIFGAPVFTVAYVVKLGNYND